MKKNAIPELDYKWWSRDKATAMKKSGLWAELNTFDVHRANPGLKQL